VADKIKRDNSIKKFPPSFEVTALAALSRVPHTTDCRAPPEHVFVCSVAVCAKEVTMTKKNTTPINRSDLYDGNELGILNMFLNLLSV
tara:strand:+ start:166 stop:429 length:264 start_codon:yes stop_codon:yes gene_type:complete